MIHKNYLSEFPAQTHAWAQSDRYALAKGFQRNGFDFFHPETYVMNQQFPGNYDEQNSHSITSVDFPIHDYIPAIIMKTVGSDSPLIFRLYILLYSIIGFFYLYKLIFIMTEDYLLSFLVVISLMCSPVIVYYQSGFLPSIPSLSNVFVGFYFLVKSMKEDRIKYYYLAILFFTIAALSRTPFAISIIALFCLEVLVILNRKEINFQKFFSIILSVFVISGYFLYNEYIRNEYASMFLGKIMPAESISEFLDIIKVSWKSWGREYFSKNQYMLFSLLLLSALVAMFLKKKRTENYKIMIIIYLLIYSLGAIMYSLLMLRQFVNHDYYFVDTLYFPITISVVVLVILVNKMKYVNYLIIIALFIMMPFFYLGSINSLRMRYQISLIDKVQITKNNYEKSKSMINKIDKNGDGVFLVLDAYAPNLPLSLINRKGFSILYTSKEKISHALGWNYDYVLIQNEFFFSDIYNNYPQIIEELSFVKTNGLITVFKKDRNINNTVMKFLGKEEKNIKLESKLDFQRIDNRWKGVNVIEVDSMLVGEAIKNNEFPLSFNIEKDSLLMKKNNICFFEVDVITTNINTDFTIVFSSNEKEENVFYQAKSYKFNNKGLNKVEIYAFIPELKSIENALSVYIWNNKKQNFRYKDVILKIL